VLRKGAMAKGFRKRFQFISDIINELKKVMWPSREELMRLTLMVLGVCLATAVVLGIVDYAFGRLVRDAIGG
jgi:preprotein translocase subunit SecE